MTVTDPEPLRETTNPTDGERIAEALRTLDMFTREQATWLFQLGLRWGYEARVDEENAAWPPPKVFTLGRWFDQAVERSTADAAARLPRPGDYKGRGEQQMRTAA